MIERNHVPVMLQEILDWTDVLENRTNPVILDGTLGEGGHTRALHRKFPDARLIGVDRDPEMLNRAFSLLEEEGIPCKRPGTWEVLEDGFVHGLAMPFSHAPSQLEGMGIRPDLVLLDLGVSIHHFRGAGRGFSYTDDSLDMRLSPDLPKTAADLCNELPESKLKEIFQEFGEEKYPGRIARRIVEERPHSSARELAELILHSVPQDRSDRKRIHPATRVFQALRIAVNREMEELDQALRQYPQVLAPGGRLLVITFHSLEDRRVKQAFRELGTKKKAPRKNKDYVKTDPSPFWILTPHPQEPTEEEINKNPPSRSSRLRVLEKNADIETV